MMDMFLCPYRFFLDYVMENSPVVQGNFLYQKYFENLLIEAVWKRVGKHKRSDAMKYLPKILEQEAQNLSHSSNSGKRPRSSTSKQEQETTLFMKLLQMAVVCLSNHMTPST